jgi:hypothetical protein
VANGKDGVIRIDTATGRTWQLERIAGGVDGWVPVVETVKDEKIGGFKPAPPEDAAAAPQPARTR